MKKRWSEEEIIFLKNNINMNIVELSNKLCKTKSAIRAKIKRINNPQKPQIDKLKNIWIRIKIDCSNREHNPNLLCKEWKDFLNFKNWMLSNKWTEGLTIVRTIKQNGFNPNNCTLIPISNICSSNSNYTKASETFFKKTGIQHALQDPNVRAKADATILKKYGVKNIGQSIDIKKKREETCLRKYGYKTALLSPDIKEKIKETNLLKYGCVYPSQNANVRIRQQITNVSKYGTPFFNKTKGFEQKELSNFVNSFHQKFIPDYTILNGKEIDLYCAEAKLGIEYCGLYWHTDISLEPRNRQYHYNKYLRCKNANIQLITIFSDEWNSRKEQVKSYLKNKISNNKNTVHGRQCSIKELDWQNAKGFINENHIQELKQKPSIAYGIYHENELLGCVSMRTHHRTNDDIVINRICFRDNYRINGGVSKLISACYDWAKESNYKRIITWSDNRWSNGNSYERCGFRLTKNLPPDYSYVLMKNPKYRTPKQSMRKKDIKCPLGVTESQYVNSIGYGRIWDCGKKQWTLNIP